LTTSEKIDNTSIIVEESGTVFATAGIVEFKEGMNLSEFSAEDFDRIITQCERLFASKAACKVHSDVFTEAIVTVKEFIDTYHKEKEDRTEELNCIKADVAMLRECEGRKHRTYKLMFAGAGIFIPASVALIINIEKAVAGLKWLFR